MYNRTIPQLLISYWQHDNYFNIDKKNLSVAMGAPLDPKQ